MGRRGASYHVRGTFQRIGTPCVVLATNRSWTSFAPLGDPPPGATLSRAFEAPVVEIWSDDDVVTTFEFFLPFGWSGELPFPLDVEPAPPGPEDQKLLARLTAEGILTRARAEKLAAELARAPRATWLRGDGVEKLLGVPYTRPLPVPMTEAHLRKIGIAARILHPTRVKAKPATKAKRAVSKKVSVDPKVLALHVHYWSVLFQMNGWKLYNRYKKHLPATRRREVDQLCNHVVMGSDEAVIERAIKDILSTIWTADDWDAAIRDPAIIADEPLDATQRADWQQRLR